MKSLRLLILGPLSILCLKSTAQVEDLMRNKNITWMVESYNDFLTDAIAEEKIGKRISGARLLKFYNPTEASIYEEFTLQYHILELAKADKLTIYKDSQCTQQVSYDVASGRIDTLDLANATTYETRTCSIGKGYVDVESLMFFRAHQILYYDSVKVQFGLKTLAIAPMRKVTNEKGEVVYWKPIFWIKVTDLQQKRVLSDESIVWAKRMTLTEGIDLRKDSVKVLKQSDEYTPKYPLFRAFHQNEKISFYKENGMDITTKYSLAERKDFFEGRDTIQAVNPINYQMETRIIPRCYPMYLCDYLGLVQNWYWDDKKKQLQIYLVATAVLKNVNNEAGEFLYKQPIFYRRTDD